MNLEYSSVLKYGGITLDISLYISMDDGGKVPAYFSLH